MSNRSKEINELAMALAKAQGQIKSAPKDGKVGGTIKYKYATLDSIWDVARKPLSDNGLSVVQLPTNEDGLTLETILIHSSGQWISSTLSLPETTGRMSELQGMGSALTYARRYMLGAIVGITTGDDDDGQQASKQSPEKAKKTNGEMTLAKLLTNLEKVERIKGFYGSSDAIKDCRPKSAELPAPDDTEGWRQLFVDARNYALDQVAKDNEALPGFGQVDSGGSDIAGQLNDEILAADDLEGEFPEIYTDQSE